MGEPVFSPGGKMIIFRPFKVGDFVSAGGATQEALNESGFPPPEIRRSFVVADGF
jgi:hypothetical protein